MKDSRNNNPSYITTITKRLLFAVLMLAAPIAHAYDFSAEAPSGQTLYYSFTSSTTVSVVSPSWNSSRPKPTGHLVIPTSVEHEGQTYTVKEISARAFSSCDQLSHVTVSEGITTIGLMAFYNCSALDTIELPSSLTQIATAAFQRTAYFDNAANWVDDLLTIGNYIITAQSQLAQTTVPEGITGIANSAFYYCINLVDVTLPSTLQFIGNLAFSDDENLDTLRLLAQQPPTFADDAFSGVFGLNVVVPCGSLTTYEASSLWNQFNLIEAECDTASPGPGPGPGPGPNPEPEAIDEVASLSMTIAQVAGGIVVKGAEGHRLEVCDATGRRVASIASATCEQRIALPSRGIYVLNLPGIGARKVVYSK